MITNLAANQQAFTSNVFLVAGERTVVIDAGWKFDVVNVIREHVDAIDALLLTHTHPDHIGNVEAITAAFGVDVYGFDPSHDLVDRPIADQEMVTLGDRDYEALFTPGHAVDHLCFYNEDEGILFAGDLIFANGAVGRTDFEGADPQTLAESVDRIVELVGPSIQEIHTGHGPSMTSDAGRHLQMAQQAARMM